MRLSEVSKSPELVERLNSMPQEPSSTALGYKGNIGGRYKLKGNPKATLRERKREAKAADWWSSRTKNVDRVRQRKRPLLLNRRKYDTMTRLVDSASPSQQRLYRGMRVDEVDFKRGQRRSMPESSWTSDRRQADVYTARGDRAKPVVMHLKGQHRSTHIAPLTRYRNAEWVTPRADYDVTSTRTREGAKHVYLRQVEKMLGAASSIGVAKAIPAEGVLPATEKEVKQEVVHRKKKQKTLSQVSAALGLASLGAQVPKAARVAVRHPRLGRSAALRRVARAAPRAKQATDAIVPASLGVGALGSLNFARLAGKEVKAQEQELNKALGQLAWRNRGYFRSLTPAEMERARQVGNKLPGEEDQQQQRRRRPVNVYKAMGGSLRQIEQFRANADAEAPKRRARARHERIRARTRSRQPNRQRAFPRNNRASWVEAMRPGMRDQSISTQTKWFDAHERALARDVAGEKAQQDRDRMRRGTLHPRRPKPRKSNDQLRAEGWTIHNREDNPPPTRGTSYAQRRNAWVARAAARDAAGRKDSDMRFRGERWDPDKAFVGKADDDRRNAAGVAAALSGSAGALASARPLGEAYRQRRLARFNRRMSNLYADMPRRMSDTSTILGRNIRGHDPDLVARSKQAATSRSFLYGRSANISRRRAERLARAGRRRLAAGGVPAVALGVYAARPSTGTAGTGKDSVGKRDDRFLRTYRRNISTGAERAYIDLGQRKRKRYGDAAAHGAIAYTGALGALGTAVNLREAGKQGFSRAARAKYAGAVGVPSAVMAAAGGRAAYNRWKEGRSLQERRDKIKAKAHERARAGELGRDRRKRDWANVPQPGVSTRRGVASSRGIAKAIRRMPRTRINPLRPSPGGVVRTRSGRMVSRRGSIVGTGSYSRSWR